MLATPELEATLSALTQRLTEERAKGNVFPPEDEVFRALALTSPGEVKAVILGQDPYHRPGQANGLAFSVRPGVPLPPTLKNIFKELQEDVGVPPPQHGSLEAWARQGVLLLNTHLTVREGVAASHQKLGWEALTDALIRKLASLDRPLAFVFWGAPAQRKLPLVEGRNHRVLCCAHPSPLSAYRGFFGSRPFSSINGFLAERGVPPIDWRL